MAHPKAAWGIEIGAYAIKAIRLEREGDAISVSDFAVIPHKKVLSSPDLDQDEMIRLGLGQFISQKSLEGEHLVMSVPGHTAFARFAKLPPVEPKKVPDIVKFEAVQQIPFPIDQVEWDYQTFASPDSPEIEVGIFAITRERIQQRLGLYGELGLSPEVMTLSPVALYNAMVYDRGDELKKQPVLFVDIGTSATDVVVADGNRCWIRTFPLGGTHFTDAIAGAFKLSYSKAEKLKLEATSSKYAKQIMQAMRPVFSDLLQDLQRSIGYYQSLNRDANLTQMVGVGSTFKIPGLRKFLGQQLQIDVIRLDEYRKLQVTGREAASFAENAVNMATAYGLALQGIGLASITANVVPTKTLRDQMWQSKTKWFAAAAALAILGSGALLIRPLLDGAKLTPGGVPLVKTVITQGNDFRNRYDTAKATSDVGHKAANMLNLLEHREIWPHLVSDASQALASTKPQPELLGSSIDDILSVPPPERRLVQLERLSAEYVPPAENTKRRFKVTMNVSLSHDRPDQFLNDSVKAWLRENAERDGVPYRIIVDTIRVNPEQLVTKTIDDAGKETTRGGGTTTTGAPSGGNAPNAGGRGGGTRGTGSDAPQGGGGLRGGTGTTITAPGGNLGGPSSAGGGTPRTAAPAAPAASNPTTSPPGNRDPITPAVPGETTIDFKSIAPVPPKPSMYPPNSTSYELPVTFEIELLDPPGTTPNPAVVADSSMNAGKEAVSS